jgi:eukaryotic-like serine/threonine-protein kinase
MNRDAVVHLDSSGTDFRIDVHVDLSGARGSAGGGSARGGLGATVVGPHGPLPSGERALRPGQILGGRYELVRVLGHGSMGAVWLANHKTLGEQVALKVMASALDSEGVEAPSMASARFRFEAQVAARLSRKTRHVVRVTDHGQEGPLAFLVMELLEGQTLEAAILQRAPMAVDEVLRLVTQIARGLEVAHAEGVLHRDLKPANVFLVEVPGGEPFVKLLDFGLARGDGSQRSAEPFATARGVVFGTPGYMSPEQAGASVEVDRRSDLWSLAAIAYEALTGELPVDGGDADELLDNVRAGNLVPVRVRRPELSEAFERFFECAFAPRASDRFATCSELADAFEHAAQAPAAPMATQRILAPVAPVPRRGGTRLRLAAALVAFVALAGVGYVVHGLPAPDPAQATGPAGSNPSGAMAATFAVPARQIPAIPASPVPAPPAASVTSEPPAAPTEVPPSPIASKRATTAPSDDLGEFKSHF